MFFVRDIHSIISFLCRFIKFFTINHFWIGKLLIFMIKYQQIEWVFTERKLLQLYFIITLNNFQSLHFFSLKLFFKLSLLLIEREFEKNLWQSNVDLRNDSFRQTLIKNTKSNVSSEFLYCSDGNGYFRTKSEYFSFHWQLRQCSLVINKWILFYQIL
jgi:hypothetical protein